MTRSELVTEYRQLIDQPTTAIISSTMANREINRAYREILGKIHACNYAFFLTSSTVTTTASTRFVDLPTDCVMPNKLIDSDNVELPYLSKEMFNFSADTGEPTGWDTAGRRLMFQPLPDAAYTYTIWYTYQPSDLSSDSSAPVIPPGFDDIIALKAAINSKMIKEEQVMEMVGMMYRERLRDLINVIGTDNTSGNRRVISSTYSIDE